MCPASEQPVAVASAPDHTVVAGKPQSCRGRLRTRALLLERSGTYASHTLAGANNLVGLHDARHGIIQRLAVLVK